MKDKDKMHEELLNAWEETYKKGQLTLWIFLALKEGPDRKYYHLTPMGQSLLESFIERNILLFFDVSLKELLLH
jgi:hypothetical protein